MINTSRRAGRGVVVDGGGVVARVVGTTVASVVVERSGEVVAVGEVAVVDGDVDGGDWRGRLFPSGRTGSSSWAEASIGIAG